MRRCTASSYLSGTKAAVDAFLSGRTWYTPPKGGYNNANAGWYDTFSNKSVADVKTLLTRKPIIGSKLFKYALEKLSFTQEQLEEEYRQREGCARRRRRRWRQRRRNWKRPRRKQAIAKAQELPRSGGDGRTGLLMYRTVRLSRR
jgi:hypothetical protein